MKCFNAIALFAALSAAGVVPETTYLLQTEAVDGGEYDGLYVSTLFTFAGTNAAILPHDKNRATAAYLKGEELYFNLGKGKYNQYPMQLGLTDESATFGTTTINAGKPTKRFAMTDSGHLVVNKLAVPSLYAEYDHGAHWRVCKWTHGFPELFWNFPVTTDNFHPHYNPPICSFVNLKMVKKT